MRLAPLLGVLACAPALATPRPSTDGTASEAFPSTGAERGTHRRAGTGLIRAQGGHRLRPPAALLTAINTHQRFALRPDGSGRFGKKQLDSLNRFLRCHHTGLVHRMSPRLAHLLYMVARHFDWRRIEVVAGYRAPRIARDKGNPRSPHARGLACDFRVEGVPLTELRDFARSLPHVGVGYYPNSTFIHVDVDRKAPVYWVDLSRPGEKSQPAEPGGEDPQGGPSPGAPTPETPGAATTTP